MLDKISLEKFQSPYESVHVLMLDIPVWIINTNFPLIEVAATCDAKTLAITFRNLTSSAKISIQWKSFDVSCQWQPKFILNVFNTCPAIMPLNLPYFNSVWIHLEEKNTLPLWTSLWIERTDNENSSNTACSWFGSRTILSFLWSGL